jgi:hypothetical protein
MWQAFEFNSPHDDTSCPPTHTAAEIQLDAAMDSWDAVSIMGFKLGEGLQLRNSDVEWQMLNDTISARLDGKVKPEVETVHIADVYATQKECGYRFRNGDLLSQLIDDLRCHIYDPMKDDFLILNVVQVTIKDYHHRGLPTKPVMYTLDHRRFKCMKDAGTCQLRVRLVLSGNEYLDQFVSKCIDAIGLRSDVRVKKPRRF